MQPVKYPQIHVQLVGKDGNAFNVLGLVLRAMREAGVSEDEQNAFKAEATSGDYYHLLATCALWVDVNGGGDQMGEDRFSWNEGEIE